MGRQAWGGGADVACAAALAGDWPEEYAAAAAATGVAALGASGLDLPDCMVCVVCEDEVKSVGLLHGRSVHLCLCTSCAAKYSVGQACPMCRQRIERLVDVF